MIGLALFMDRLDVLPVVLVRDWLIISLALVSTITQTTSITTRPPSPTPTLTLPGSRSTGKGSGVFEGFLHFVLSFILYVHCRCTILPLYYQCVACGSKYTIVFASHWFRAERISVL